MKPSRGFYYMLMKNTLRGFVKHRFLIQVLEIEQNLTFKLLS